MLQVCRRVCGQELTPYISKKSLALAQLLGSHFYTLGISLGMLDKNAFVYLGPWVMSDCLF